MGKKSFLNSVIFNLLVKGINGANLYDTRVQQEVCALPKSFSVSLAVFPYGNYICFEVNPSGVHKMRQINNADLQIIFKNNKIAQKVLLGKMSIADAFSSHAILLKGDIYKAMGLVRIINIVENYLFPRFYTKAIPYEKKQVSAFKMYCYVLFGCTKKQRKLEDMK